MYLATGLLALAQSASTLADSLALMVALLDSLTKN
jgi:hypothetical protein